MNLSDRNTVQALAGLKVVELGSTAAPGYAGRWLAAFGAEVTVIEPPEGHWARRHRISHEDGAPVGSLFRFLSAGKQCLTLDLTSENGRQALANRLAAADALVYDQAALDPAVGLEDLKRRNPRLVTIAVSPFGEQGPYVDYQSTQLTMLAMSGFQFIVGDPERAPLSLPGLQADYIAGLYAAAGLLSMLITQAGGDVSVSTFEAVASMFRATHGSNATMRRRNGNRYQDIYPNTLLPCKDGMVSFACFPQDMWERLAVLMERPDLLDDPRFATTRSRFENADAIDAVMKPWLSEQTKREVFNTAQGLWRLPVGPCFELSEVMQDEQYTERDFWTRPAGESLLFPGLPVAMSRTPWRIGVGSSEAGDADARTISGPVDDGMPLKGMKMVDLTQVWAGPIATRILADLGADVIRVERPLDHTAPEPRLVEQLELHRNKRRLGLNLQDEAGREVFRALIADADILVENFSARVMANFGLDYEALSKINPGLVMLSLNGFGHAGPYRDYSAFGPAIEPMTGLTTLLGYPGEEPRAAAIAYADPIAGLAAAAAVLTALVHKRRTGEGQFIDFSMIEATTNVVGEYFIEQQVTGKEPPRMGNRHAQWSPQGTFRCTGQDEWVSISVRSEEEWQALCRTAGLPDLSGLEYGTASQRRAQEGLIEARIEAWTQKLDKHEVVRLLQAAGVPSGAVANAEDVRTDPHLNACGFFTHISWPDGTGMPVSTTPLLFNSKRRASWQGEPPPRVDDEKGPPPQFR